MNKASEHIQEQVLSLIFYYHGAITRNEAYNMTIEEFKKCSEKIDEYIKLASKHNWPLR